MPVLLWPSRQRERNRIGISGRMEMVQRGREWEWGSRWVMFIGGGVGEGREGAGWVVSLFPYSPLLFLSLSLPSLVMKRPRLSLSLTIILDHRQLFHSTSLSCCVACCVAGQPARLVFVSSGLPPYSLFLVFFSSLTVVYYQRMNDSCMINFRPLSQ